jgi:hypothetical protein
MKMTPLFNFRLRGQFAFALTLFVMLASAPCTKAFALLGPYTDWMVETNGYHQPADIGGPMDINEEYRWNVPIVTYGFDKSFTDYFGANGIAAVESAIQILNDLPAASDIVLTNFPTDTRRSNFRAVALNVYDLKSTALALLLEQMGLGQPTRNILGLRGWSPDLQYPPAICTNEVCPGVVMFQNLTFQRNFDPEALNASFLVNGISYDAFLSSDGDIHDLIEFPLDPQASAYSPVADAFSLWYSGLQPGTFYAGLTRDDAGGLGYLLSATNVNWESLDVLFTGNKSRANKRLRGAWRPGVEKITFMAQPQNKRGKFQTAVFKFTAYYATNGMVFAQPAKRVVSQPDILFSVAETYLSDSNSPMFLRTGTSNWVNNASQNGRPQGAGPGVITSPIKIVFDKLGPQVSSDGINPTTVFPSGWASFDASTNPPVLYPQNIGQTNLLVRLHFYDTNATPMSEIGSSLFPCPVPIGGQANLQISTNNTDWITLTTVTNTGSIIRWDFLGAKVPISFRAMPIF